MWFGFNLFTYKFLLGAASKAALGKQAFVSVTKRILNFDRQNFFSCPAGFSFLPS
jgi:hypothetical protein